MTPETCGNCKCWESHGNMGRTGECNRYPPTLHVISETDPERYKRLLVTQRLPYVGEAHWCGEWRLK